jgi:hypothetical protein
MRFGCVVLALALATSIGTKASASIVTQTYSGTAAGSNDLGLFGIQGSVNTAFTATFVFDTDTIGAGTQTNASGTIRNLYGGSVGTVSPLLSASLTINGQTFSFPTTANLSQTIVDYSAGIFQAQSSVSDANNNSLLVRIYTTDPAAPTGASVETPITYTPVPKFSVPVTPSYFQHGSGAENTLTLTASMLTVTVAGSVPEASTWAMMVLGFAGVGFLTYRRRRPSTALAA